MAAKRSERRRSSPPAATRRTDLPRRWRKSFSLVRPGLWEYNDEAAEDDGTGGSRAAAGYGGCHLSFRGSCRTGGAIRRRGGRGAGTLYDWIVRRLYAEGAVCPACGATLA